MTRDMLSVVYAYGAFILAYGANILFSLYLNVELLKQAYSRKMGKIGKESNRLSAGYAFAGFIC